MKIEKGYLFARQISAGEIPVLDNVIFDAGVFNMNRMESGFNFTQNIQRTPQEWGISTGQNAIEHGYMTPYFGTGATFIAYGTDRDEDYFLEDGAITGVGRSKQGNPISISCYLPITMRTLQEEGYSALKFYVSGNAVGIPDAGPGTNNPGCNVAVYETASAGMMNSLGSGSNAAPWPGIEEETEEVITIDLSYYSDRIPTYIRLTSWGGTTRFRKIWFE